MAQSVTDPEAVGGDDVRALAKHFAGGSRERQVLAAIAGQLEEIPRLRKLAREPVAAGSAPQGIESSLASIARSLELLVARYTDG